MFCIIEGRFYRGKAPDRPLPETPVSTQFTACLFIIILFLFSFYHLQFCLHLHFCFLLLFYFLFLHNHSSAGFSTNLPLWRFFGSSPFNQFFWNDPASVRKILVGWLFCHFGLFFRVLPFFSIQPVFFNEPSLCHEKSGWICVFEAFFGFWTDPGIDFYAVFGSRTLFLTRRSPKNG